MDNLILNEDALDYLNKYKGVLPKYLLGVIDINKYDDNLKRLGLYDKIYDEYYNIRIERLKSNKKDYDLIEFKKWLKDNPEFKELL